MVNIVRIVIFKVVVWITRYNHEKDDQTMKAQTFLMN